MQNLKKQWTKRLHGEDGFPQKVNFFLKIRQNRAITYSNKLGETGCLKATHHYNPLFM